MMRRTTPPLSTTITHCHYVVRPPPPATTVAVLRRRGHYFFFSFSTTSSTNVNENIRTNDNSISIPESMSSARTLEEVLASIEEQTLADDELRSSMRPTPWFNLLHYPSGAAWRSSDKVLGGGGGRSSSSSRSLRPSPNDADYDDEDDEYENNSAGEMGGAKTIPKTNKRNNNNNLGGDGLSVLAQTQFNLLRRSERTNKQLRRTYRNILDVQMSFSRKRERERRLAANSVPSSNVVDDYHYKQHGNNNNNDKQRLKQQSIDDERGRQVGDWREKSGIDSSGSSSSGLDSNSGNTNASSHIPPPPPPLYCEDPSVALSLSIGLYSSTAAGAKERKRILNNLLNNNGNSHDDDNSSSNNNNNNNSMEGENKSDSGGGGGSTVATTDYYYVENEAARMAGAKSAKVANRLAKSGLGLAPSSTDLASNKKPVSYGPEQTMTNLKYRFGPNYSIVRRVLSEVQSLLGGHGGSGSGTTSTTHFQPRRVLDFGSGVGSSGAAALDVFGVGRSSSNSGSNGLDVGGIDWIHSIDASQCMRETTEKVLRSILEGSPWIDEKSSSTGNLNRLEEEEALLLAEYERLLFNEDSDSTNRERKRMERRRKRMERWDQSWERRTDARTRLTFGESIVDSSSIVSSSSRPIGSDTRGVYGSDSETDDESTNRRRLPWQDKLDEQRRRVTEQKYNNQQDQQKNKGSFDLILCSYTLTELPSVPASLAAATLLWEKLAPNGVLVIVEPGTPDGFGMLRSVRSMLLECCPPPEVRKKRKRMKVKTTTSIDKKTSTGTDILNGLTEEDNDEDDDTWPEECHVIAPCTHNGTCPMSRHQKNHIKRNTRFSRYESAEPKDQDSDDDVRDDAGKMDRDDDDEEMSFQELLDEWDNMPERQKDELKMMLGGGDDMSDEEAKAMLEYMESMDSDEEEDEDGEDDDSDSDHDSDSLETDDVGNEQDYYNIDEGSSYINEPSSNKETKPSTMAKTDVFGSSFCSFVHTFPGGTTRRKGEKFAYLVVQKRVPVLDESFNSNSNDNNHCTTTVPTTENHETLNEVDIVDMLSKSVHHAQKLKKEELTYRLRQRRSGGTNDDDSNIELHDSPTYIYHMKQSNTLLQRAVDVEDKFLESTIDKLGLELLHGDYRRKSWGRLIRAPLKKKGHVLVDYCSAGCGGGGGCSSSVSTTDDDGSGGTQGRITRQKISRGWSARAAPGCYSAARKARWGGLWPDMSERVKRLDKEENDSKKMIKSQSM